jgi:hypothetical protein
MESKYRFSVSFWVAREKTHSVEVKSWASKGLHGEDVWHWNVYGHVFDNHPLFATPERLEGMPLHWGATFDEFRTTSPAFGIKYDWQKENKAYTFGSDYSHYQDPEDWQSPLEGIPYLVEQDALDLAAWLADNAACELAEKEAQR